MSQITGGVHRGHAAGDTNIEKAASQLVSDTKYKVKQRLGDNLNKMAPATLMKAYMEQLSKSPAGPVRALAQKKLTGGSMKENFNIDALASSSVANALFKVFVEGVKKEEYVLGEEYLEELMKKNKNGEPLYSVKVYYKNGTTYTRWSSRQDMSRIRSNPNVKSIEMIDYAPPAENKGDRSSKKDYDGDGKVESGAKEYRGSVHNAIQRKKGGTPDGRDTSSVKENLDFVEEDFIQEKKNSKKGGKFYNVMRGKNTELVKIFPEVGKSYNEEFFPESAVSTAQQKFMGMVHAYKKGEMSNASPKVKKAAKEMSDTEAKKFASTKHEGLPQHVKKKVQEETACDSSEPQRDTRGDYAKANLIKNKLRSALGVKNPIVMVSNEEDVKEGEVIDERRREDRGTPRKPRDKAFELVAKSMGTSRMGVQPRGQKKEPGKKPPSAGEYGSERRSPEQIVKNNREIRKRGQENMSSRFD